MVQLRWNRQYPRAAVVLGIALIVAGGLVLHALANWFGSGPNSLAVVLVASLTALCLALVGAFLVAPMAADGAVELLDGMLLGGSANPGSIGPRYRKAERLARQGSTRGRCEPTRPRPNEAPGIWRPTCA